MSVQVTEQLLVNETKLEDNDLLDLIHQGNTNALDVLINRYKRFVFAKAQTYFLIGGDICYM